MDGVRWKAYIFSTSKSHNLVKGPPAVILANGISLFKTDMIVS